MRTLESFLLGGGGAIILAHLAIPPLSVLSRGEKANVYLAHLYDALPQELDLSFVTRSLCLDGVDANHLTLQHFTYMFVHSDYAHLFSNLLGFLQLAPLIHERMGYHVYFIFLGGGAASAMETPLKLEQLKHMMRINFSVPDFLIPPPSSPIAFLSDPLKLLNKPLQAIGERLSAIIPRHIVHLGSSGGVSALAGCSVVLFVSDAVSIAWKVGKEFFRGGGGGRGGTSSQPNASLGTRIHRAIEAGFPSQPDHSINSIINRSLSAISICSMLYTEIAKMRSGDNVDHAGHLQGAAFGVAYASFYLFIRSHWRTQRQVV